MPGCPLAWFIYRTPPGGTRSLVGIFERTPIFKFDTTPIQIHTLWSTQSPNITPLTATMSLTTTDYANYDKQSWALSVVQTSIYSTSSMREGSINF